MAADHVVNEGGGNALGGVVCRRHFRATFSGCFQDASDTEFRAIAASSSPNECTRSGGLRRRRRTRPSAGDSSMR